MFKRHGIEIIYRVSLTMVASFGFMLLCTLFWPVVHHLFLLIFLLVVGIFAYIFVWCVQSSVFIRVFRNIARVASFFYLVLQTMSLVDMAFTFHDWLLMKIDETNVTLFVYYYP